MVVAIHQPNFLPWLGYFYKMARADRFVFLDSVPFTKGGYTNRVKIKTATGPQWLTVPVVTHGKLGQPILEVVCSDTIEWRKKIPLTLRTNYQGCPFFQPHADRLVTILEGSGERLAEINIGLLGYLAQELGIATPVVRSSEMAARGTATDLLIAICKELGADRYLSGSGGADYQEEAAFAAAGLRLEYANYPHPTYVQAFGEFAAGLSIVDLLFNCGPESRRILGVPGRRRECAG
jgi:hypothetical protein